MFLLLMLTLSTSAQQLPMQRVIDDAIVLDRVAEASKRDLPRELLERIVVEDIELLRGRRGDGSYQYATYERFEAGRTTTEFSIQPRGDKMETVEVRGTNIYRLILDVPSRRLLLAKNRPVWIERVDVEYIAQGSTQLQTTSFEIKAWVQPGEIRPLDMPAITRQVTARVIATADPKHGYGNLEVALVQARIVDLATSPYAEAVTSAKAALRALQNGELPALRTAAQRMRDALTGPASAVTVRPAAVVAQPPQRDVAERLEMQAELQVIEDLLTGSESERRQGLDRLHQLIRSLRP